LDFTTNRSYSFGNSFATSKFREMNKTILVTCGSGFVGIHTILQLLQKGFNVHTTIRSLSKKWRVVNALIDAGIEDLSRRNTIAATMPMIQS
jgi:nucleoside-diphosphate-sugar epimerase